MNRTLGLQKDRYSQYIGPTTDFEPSLIDLSNFDKSDESSSSRGTLRKVSDVDTFLLLPDSNTQGYVSLTEDSDAIENLVAPHGPALIELYFRIIHPSIPILQKNIFFEKYDRSYREISPASLAVIYILAINWWDQSEKLLEKSKPDVRELERYARVTLADAMFRPKLSTVQAGLLLSQRPEGDQWAPTGQLVAIAQELGLHLDCTNWKIPPWERGLRKRLAWGMYMQDKWGALIHGRPSHIFASNWAVQPLTDHDFPDEETESASPEEAAELERGRLLFRNMVTLTQILAEILEIFYTLQAMSSITAAGAQGPHLVLQLAKPIQLKLKNWFTALPSSCRMKSSSSSSASISSLPSSKLSLVGSLHLHYFATDITLHRRIIRSLYFPPSSSYPSPPTRSQAEPPSSPPLGRKPSPSSETSIDPYIVHICRSAAKTRLISAMDFVNRLTTSHLKAFWYFASKTNFALIGTFGSLLWATAPGREEAEWYARRLGEYRWTLGVSCKGTEGQAEAEKGEGKGNTEEGELGHGGLTAFAMTMLDISTGMLRGLPEKPTLSGSEGEKMQKALGLGKGLGMGSPAYGSSSGIDAARLKTQKALLEAEGMEEDDDDEGSDGPGEEEEEEEMELKSP